MKATEQKGILIDHSYKFAITDVLGRLGPTVMTADIQTSRFALLRMGRIFKRYLDQGEVWRCSACSTHLSTNDQVLSKQFTGRGGRAFLFNKVINITTAQHEKRVLITGLHTVADIYCLDCETCLGWKYEEAFEATQKYKEGKYILERTRISKDDRAQGPGVRI